VFLFWIVVFLFWIFVFLCFYFGLVCLTCFGMTPIGNWRWSLCEFIGCSNILYVVILVWCVSYNFLGQITWNRLG
jgi:hypothetical protein